MARIIDLSQTVEAGGVVFPLLPPTEMTPLPKLGAAALVMKLTLGDHTGTHIDSLAHFDPNGKTIEHLPLEYCYGEAIVLDLSHKRAKEIISIQDLKAAAAKAGVEIRPGDIVLIRTGADRLLGSPEYATYEVGIGVDTVRWLVQEKGVKVFGVDEVSIDADKTRPAHMLVKEFEYYHIENLTNLERIPRSRFTFAGFPLKLAGASGGLMRAVAIVED